MVETEGARENLVRGKKKPEQGAWEISCRTRRWEGNIKVDRMQGNKNIFPVQ